MATFSGDGGQKTLFRNWVVATTSKSSRRGAGSETVEKPNFKQLLNMVKQSGATHSKIVHKRVKFLISTDDAYKFKTQSVRKAIKYGIPILHQAFLSTILNTGIIPLNLENYVLCSNGNDMSLTSQKYQSKNLYRQKYCHLMTLKLKRKQNLKILIQRRKQRMSIRTPRKPRRKRRRKRRKKNKKKNMKNGPK